MWDNPRYNSGSISRRKWFRQAGKIQFYAEQEPSVSSWNSFGVIGIYGKVYIYVIGKAAPQSRRGCSRFSFCLSVCLCVRNKFCYFKKIFFFYSPPLNQLIMNGFQSLRCLHYHLDEMKKSIMFEFCTT